MTNRPTDWIPLLIIPAAVVFSYATTYRRIVVQWFEGKRGRDWPKVSALIDVVSTAVQTEQTRSGERVIGFLATLTYFYRNPDLQIGEYCRMFSTESEAHDWAAPYKGRTILVHVDPRDPTRSILRKDEL